MNNDAYGYANALQASLSEHQSAIQSASEELMKNASQIPEKLRDVGITIGSKILADASAKLVGQTISGVQKVLANGLSKLATPATTTATGQGTATAEQIAVAKLAGTGSTEIANEAFDPAALDGEVAEETITGTDDAVAATGNAINGLTVAATNAVNGVIAAGDEAISSATTAGSNILNTTLNAATNLGKGAVSALGDAGSSIAATGENLGAAATTGVAQATTSSLGQFGSYIAFAGQKTASAVSAITAAQSETAAATAATAPLIENVPADLFEADAGDLGFSDAADVATAAATAAQSEATAAGSAAINALSNAGTAALTTATDLGAATIETATDLGTAAAGGALASAASGAGTAIATAAQVASGLGKAAVGAAVGLGEDAAVAGGLATAGAALDATGIGSVVGVVLGIGGLLASIFAPSSESDPVLPPPPNFSYQAGA